MVHVGIFETLLVIDGKPVEAAGHFERLRDATGINASGLLQRESASLDGYHRLRIDVTTSGSLTTTSASIPIPSMFSGKFAKLSLITKRLQGDRLNKGHGSVKIADRPELEALDAHTTPAFPLLVDGSGKILETTKHNVFIVEGEALTTPPLDGRILPGVTRQVVLEEARKLGIRCREEPIDLERAKKSDGMFLTNAIIGIGWVEQCDDTRWSQISPIAKELHQALALRWRHA